MSSSKPGGTDTLFGNVMHRAMGAMGMSGGSAPSPLGSAPFGQNGGQIIMGGNAHGASKGGLMINGGSRRRRSRRRGSKRHSRRRQRGGILVTPGASGGGRTRRLKRHSGKARRHRTRSYSAGGRRK